MGERKDRFIQEAHELAKVALAKIERHEVECAQRYKQLIDSISGLHRVMWVVAGSIISLLLSGVLYLFGKILSAKGLF
jgi:hypothetical protein